MLLGHLLHHHFKRYAEAEAAYREAIALDPKDNWAWTGLGDLFQYHLLDYAEAEKAYRKGIEQDPRSSRPWNGLGNLCCDCLDRPSDAAEAYDEALRLEPANASAHQNRLFLRRDFLGEGAGAYSLMAEIRALPKPGHVDTDYLHEALFAAYESNWGLACDALVQALNIVRADGFSANTTDDWFRASAVLLHLNYGTELLALLHQRGDTARLRPWVEALRAHHLGDRRVLQNIAPEIRSAAEVFYEGIDTRLKKLPEKTRRRPLLTAKKTRERRTGDKARRS